MAAITWKSQEVNLKKVLLFPLKVIKRPGPLYKRTRSKFENVSNYFTECLKIGLFSGL